MSKSDGGKGSSPRPFSVTQQEYDSRWDLIFGRDSIAGRDKPKEQEKPEEQPKETKDE